MKLSKSCDGKAAYTIYMLPRRLNNFNLIDTSREMCFTAIEVLCTFACKYKYENKLNWYFKQD